jgi:hypothetical protein
MAYVEALRSFLTRPYPLLPGDWSGDEATGATLIRFQPLKTYLNLPLILGKLLGFSYLRAGLRFEIRINGTRFHYGQMVAAFLPLSPNLQTYTTTQTQAGVLTQFPSVVLDPGPSEVGILEVPYCFPRHFMSITDFTDPSNLELGELIIKVLSPLRVVSQTVVPRVNFTVYVSLVQPVLSAFTSLDISTPLFQEQAADNSMRVTPEANNMIATRIPSVSFHAGMDPTNSIARQENVIGISRKEMSLAHIYTKPNYILSTPWSTADSAGVTLAYREISPTHMPNHTYLSHVAKMFKYWRGSIRYHLRVVASGFHSGRLAISWEPSYRARTGITPQERSNRMTMVVDIQETTDVYFTIPYMSRLPWLSNELGDAAFSFEVSNGSLLLEVLNPLAVPDNSVSTVECILWAYGSSDLEFALPYVNQVATVVPGKLMEEQCAEMPLGDSRFGDIDGSFSVPGGMSMGEKVDSLSQVLSKKAYIRMNRVASGASHSSVFEFHTLANDSHFLHMSRMFVCARGSIDYAGFVSYPELPAHTASEYWIGFGSGYERPRSARAGIVQIRDSAPNCMLTVPYYTTLLFHTTNPIAARRPDDNPYFLSETAAAGTAQYVDYASAGNDFFFAYLVPLR